MKSNRFLLIAGAVALLSVGGSTLVGAQELDRPFRVTLGPVFPADNDITSLTDDLHLNLGLSYDMWGTVMGTRYYRGGAFVDMTWGRGNGNEFNSFGVGGFGRIYLGDQSASSWRPYVGASLGIYFLDYQLGAIGENSSRIGFGLFGGVESLNGLFGQVGYRWIGASRGFNGSGLALNVGYRF